jgi:hypothetical protein
MTIRRPTTLGELLADSAFAARQATLRTEVAQKEKIVREQAQPYLHKLRCIGYDVTSLDDLVREYAPLSEQAADILLEWLSLSSNESTQEQIIRAIGAARGNIDPRPLLELFDRSPSDTTKWAIANAIAELRPSGIVQWIVSSLARPQNGKSREMLLVALARVAPHETANPVLLEHFEEMPGHVALALADSGGAAEATFLREESHRFKGWVRKEIDRATRSIVKSGR